MVSLQTDQTDHAYHLGRLLAVLEQVQRAALPGVNATIIDRYFGTASSAPAGVFGRLMRGAQPHLSRLERDRPATFHALQRRMEEVCGNLEGFPRTLTLEQQGLFALGYYHQRAHDRKEATERRQQARQPENGSESTEEQDGQE
jgi:CRISPR-associated protein Csd1